MEYLKLLNKCKDGPLQRVYIEGGQSSGRMAFPEKPKHKPTSKNIMTGFQYAEEVKLKDQLEDLQIEEHRNKKRLDEVEGLTSIGTLPNLSDLLPDKLTQVYENYSFSTRSDKVLMIHEFRQEILEQISANQVTIIKGVTGCGKTTQVPQFILDDNKDAGMHCNMVVTQPRRIAAVSVAKRVCHERGWPLGSLVGYQIGLDRCTSEDTRLNYVTTGVLLQQLIQKQSLVDFTHIIIDEVHERDSETDFLLIVVKKFLREQNCRTKVVLMSATMNIAPFLDYFSRTIRGTKFEPPVIELGVRTKFSVQYYYLDHLHERLGHLIPDIEIGTPCISKSAYSLARQLIEIFAVIDQKEHPLEQVKRSVLVFLPGIMEIETMYEVLIKEASKSGEKWWICPLHSSVTHEEQHLVFKPPPMGQRKIILTTNIAESSITVTDVKYVIDFCLTKQQIVDIDTGYTELKLSWISKSQGTQRAGRVGRVMPGRVYRFLTKDNYQLLPDQTPPEITRCPLDILVLKAKELNVGPPEDILGLAIDPPDLSNIHKTVLSLKEVGALLLTTRGTYYENDGDLTFLGRVMASLPLDTKLSKLIILGHTFSLLNNAVTMACALSLKSIFSTPFKLQLEAYNSKLSWADCSCSDPVAFLNAYLLWRHKTKLGYFKRTGGQTEDDWCKSVFIQKNVIREVSRLETEVLGRLKGLGIESAAGDARVNWDEVEKSLILKLIIAGAFYPHYFAPVGSDEKEAVKELSGRDPFNTVYLSGMPPNQPGKLYVHAIKNSFKFCGSDIKVFFDSSCKTYLSFGSSITEKRSGVDRNQNKLVPGKINLAVYRAIKMRQLSIPIVIPVLTPHDAAARAQEIFEDLTTPRLWKSNKALSGNKSQLPGIGTNILSIRITHIDNPSRFWVSINDDVAQNKVYWIHSSINSSRYQIPAIKGDCREGQICIAKYAEDNKFYRAKVLQIIASSNIVRCRVFFIDYGNEENINRCDLRDFPPELEDVKNEPPLAINASLAEIGPAEDKNAKGEWSYEAINKFKHYFQDNVGVAKVYSAVNGVMSLTLYDDAALNKARGGDSPMPFSASFNHYLISHGHAEAADEPYLSREDHMKREAAENCPESISSSSISDTFLTNCFEPAFEDFEPINEAQCRSSVTLKGPRSPLELQLFSFPKKCQGKEVFIEWNSVNSVLLDTNPMDSQVRLIVAATVTQTSTSKLTLRNTTIMPNLNGLASLICLLFAPRIELRADPERISLIGALCGLGFHPDTGESFYPENDMEITFDSVINHNDLTVINRLRFWMDYMLGGGDGLEAGLSRPDVANAQHKIKGYILSLLHTRRARKVPVNELRTYEWDQIPSAELLDPHGKTKSLYPLIWGINLNGDDKVDQAMLAQLETLENYANGREKMRNGVQCVVCQVYLKSVPEVKIHLSTNQHKMRVKELQGRT